MRDLLYDKPAPLPAEPEPTQPGRAQSGSKSARSARSVHSKSHSATRSKQSLRHQRTARPSSASPGRTFTKQRLTHDTAAVNTAGVSTRRPYSASSAVGRQSRYDTRYDDAHARQQVRATPLQSDYSPLPARRTLGWSTETEVHIIDDDYDDVPVRDHAIDNDDVATPRADADADGYVVTSQQESEPRREVIKPYQPKPFTELVKVQRPEVTRKDRDRK